MGLTGQMLEHGYQYHYAITYRGAHVGHAHSQAPQPPFAFECEYREIQSEADCPYCDMREEE